MLRSTAVVTPSAPVGTAGHDSHELRSTDSGGAAHNFGLSGRGALGPVGSAVQDNGQQTETSPVGRQGTGRRGAGEYPVADCPTLGETGPVAGRQNSRHVVMSVFQVTSGDPKRGKGGVSLRLAAAIPASAACGARQAVLFSGFASTAFCSRSLRMTGASAFESLLQ